MSPKKLFFYTALFGLLIYIATFRAAFGNADTLAKLVKPYSGGYGTAFESPHERSSYLLLLSLVEHQSFNLEKENAAWGGVDVGTYQGKIYSFFPPGLPFLSIPFFIVGSLVGLGQAFSYLPVILAASGCIFFIALISKNIFKLFTESSIFAALLFAFSTPSWSYAVTYYQHLITAFLLLSSFYTAYLFQKNNNQIWLFTSLGLYGVSWLFDYTNLIILFPTVMYLFVTAYNNSSQKKNISIIIASLIVIAGSVALYNSLVFGHWCTTSNNLVRYVPSAVTQIVEKTQRESPFTLFNPLHIPYGMYVLLLAPYRGLLFFSPIFFSALWGVWLWRKVRTPASLTLLCLFFSTLLLYSLFKYPWGGWAFGPRVIIPAMAALAPFVAFWLEKSLFKAKKIVALVAVVYSTALALLGALTTNMIPYITRAHENNGDYTFKRLFEYISIDRSPSIVYNTFFSFLPLIVYYVLILVLILIVFISIMYRITQKK
jgi:hypothetical protein